MLSQLSGLKHSKVSELGSKNSVNTFYMAHHTHMPPCVSKKHPAPSSSWLQFPGLVLLQAAPPWLEQGEKGEIRILLGGLSTGWKSVQGWTLGCAAPLKAALQGTPGRQRTAGQAQPGPPAAPRCHTSPGPAQTPAGRTPTVVNC